MRLRHVWMVVLACGAAAASAQNLKPGLWQIQNRMGGALGDQMAQAQAAMAAMPPDQRKKMEEMMARQGVRMQGGGQGMSAQICMSKEMAERNEVPMDRGDCKFTTQQRSGNLVKVAFTCTDPPSSGEGQVTLLGAEAYNSKWTIRTTVDGKPETMTMDGSGKWLSANCGNLKPIGQK